MRKLLKMQQLVRGMFIAIALVSICSFVFASGPAFASGSTIDIGYTVLSGNTIKGSGSDHNTGDYANVCVAIMSQQYFTSTVSQSCRTNLGYNTWSAPDVNVSVGPPNAKVVYYTRITAYNSSGSKLDNKNSNHITISYNSLGNKI